MLSAGRLLLSRWQWCSRSCLFFPLCLLNSVIYTTHMKHFAFCVLCPTVKTRAIQGKLFNQQWHYAQRSGAHNSHQDDSLCSCFVVKNIIRHVTDIILDLLHGYCKTWVTDSITIVLQSAEMFYRCTCLRSNKSSIKTPFSTPYCGLRLYNDCSIPQQQLSVTAMTRKDKHENISN